jgi:hypothetical protein
MLGTNNMIDKTAVNLFLMANEVGKTPEQAESLECPVW